MKAPPNLLTEPPTLNNAGLYKFEIGCTLDEQRSGEGSACIRLLAGDECAGPDDRLAYEQARVLHIGNRVAGDAPDFHVDCDCTASPDVTINSTNIKCLALKISSSANGFKSRRDD